MKKIILISIAILNITAVMTSCKKDRLTEPESAPLRKFSITGTASSPLFGPGLREENRIAEAFVDLTNRKIYTIEEAVSHQSNLDFVFATSYYGGTIQQLSRDLIVSSIEDGKGWSTNPGDRTLNDFGLKTQCYFRVLADNELEDFSALQNQQQLNSIFEQIKPDQYVTNTTCNTGSVHKVKNVAFKTNTGKRGVFRMTSYLPNFPFYFVIDIKMEK